MKRAWVASGIILASLVIALSNNGCGDDDDEDKDTTSHTGKKGELCQTTRDCAPGLACIPRLQALPGTGSSSDRDGVLVTTGGVCTLASFNVAPTGKECAATQCDVVEDCCKVFNVGTSSSCAAQKDECENAKPDDSACEFYRENCVCQATNKYSCDAGWCHLKCIDDTSCKTSGPGGTAGKCVGGQCSQCAIDTDCKTFGADQTCVNGKCQEPCKGDGDCEFFDRCVAGKCVPGGCQSARECIAASKNVEATCGTDGKCLVPCQTDLECSNPKGYNFLSCINNLCTYTGCSSDKDCSLYNDGLPNGISSSSSGGTSRIDNLHFTCRERGLPGNIIRNP